MSEFYSDIFAGMGLLLTLIGAWLAARSVILKRDDAINIGVTRIAYDTHEENAALPLVQNLLSASRGARQGLFLIGLGTALQLLPVVARLLPELMPLVRQLIG